MSPTAMAAPAPPAISTFRLPDLISYCHQFPVGYHKNGDAIGAASEKWFGDGCRNFTEEKRRRLHSLMPGLLTGYCYRDCDDEHLRVVGDFMTFLFDLDDLSDGMMTTETEALADIVMNALSFPHSYHPIHADSKGQPEEESDVSKLARDFWSRCIKDAGPGVQARFCASLQLFFEAVNDQANDRDSGNTPDLKAYIACRRNDSGVKPLMDLLEYSLRIELPDFVINDPIIEAIKQNTDEFVAWSNDIFSYNVEQSRGDTHNLVAVLAESHGLDLQSAVDQAGEMCREAIDLFCENRKKIPSWSPEIDRGVAGYVQGLADWISGSLQWSFVSERYFGRKCGEVKKTLVVELASRRVNANAA